MKDKITTAIALILGILFIVGLIIGTNWLKIWFYKTLLEVIF